MSYFKDKINKNKKLKNKKVKNKIIKNRKTIQKAVCMLCILITVIILDISVLNYNIQNANSKYNDNIDVNIESLEDITNNHIIELGITKEMQIEELKETNSEVEKQDDINIEKTKVEKDIGEYMWYLEIPSINLKAEIKETTEEEVIKEYVGHFEETAVIQGNVGLAAHNRGYENNYFENIKNLGIGDEIKYNYYGKQVIYKVTSSSIIEDTNWSKLEDTEINTITLITCIENEPTLRRCVQAQEIK